MKKYIKLSILTAFVALFVGCDSFLDREPLDQVTPQMYFRTVDDLAAYTINNYSFQTVTSNYGLNLFGIDNHTDNQAGTGYPVFWQPGEKKCLQAVVVGTGVISVLTTISSRMYYQNMKLMK